MPLSHLQVDPDHPLEVVVVDDHDMLRHELVSFLSRPGLRVRGVEDADALDEALRQHPADILVVDLNLPGEDGLSICRRMREAFPEMGLIMLTARVMPSDKTAGYQSGADVYLTKPANVLELEAVVGNLSRRLRRRVANGLKLDMALLQLKTPSQQTIALTRQEATLLYELAMAPERRLSAEVILLRLADFNGDARELNNNLPVIISRLRQKMDASPGVGDVIKAVRGFGYQLVQPITVRT